MHPKNQPSDLQSLLDRRDVSAYLKCSIATLKRYGQRGWLEPIRIGPRMVRYRREDVLAFEARGAQMTAEKNQSTPESATSASVASGICRNLDTPKPSAGTGTKPGAKQTSKFTNSGKTASSKHRETPRD